LIGTAKTVANLNDKSVTTVTLPTSERQARVLAGLESDQQRDVWQKSVKTAPGDKPTEAHVKNVRNEMFPKQKPQRKTPSANQKRRAKKLEAECKEMGRARTEKERIRPKLQTKLAAVFEYLVQEIEARYFSNSDRNQMAHVAGNVIQKLLDENVSRIPGKRHDDWTSTIMRWPEQYHPPGLRSLVTT